MAKESGLLGVVIFGQRFHGSVWLFSICAYSQMVSGI